MYMQSELQSGRSGQPWKGVGSGSNFRSGTLMVESGKISSNPERWYGGKLAQIVLWFIVTVE